MNDSNGCARFFKSLTRTKKLKTETSDLLVTQLRRCLTTFDITLIGISSTLGSGVYILTGEVSAKTGASIIISITLAAIASVLCGLCYTEFAARVPKAGSAYVYSYVAIGEFFAFVVGWNLVLEYGIGAASVVKGFTTYVDAITDSKIKNFTINTIGQPSIFGSDIYIDIFSFITAILVTTSVSLSVKKASILNSFCTIINVIVIVMVVAMGSFYAKPENIQHFMPNGIPSVIAGSSSCFFAFIGFDAVCMVAEEAKKPNKSVPISVVTTILTCYVGFVAAAIVLNMMLPYTEIHGSASLATAFKKVNQHAATYIISIGACFGLLGNAIASMMMMPRFLYSMAQDGLIFKFFSSVHERSNIPLYSTIFGGLLTGTMALFLDLHALVQMVSVGTILAYTLVTLSILVVRYKTERLGMARTKSRLSGISISYDGRIFIDPQLLEEEREFEQDTLKKNNVETIENLADSDKEPDTNYEPDQHPDPEFSRQEIQRKPLEGENPPILIEEEDLTQYPGEIMNLPPNDDDDDDVDLEEIPLIDDDNNSLRDLLISWHRKELILPTPFTQYVALMCSFLIMVEIFGLAAVLHYFSPRLFKGDVVFIILLIVLVLCIVLTTSILSMMPQNQQRLFFKVPFVPWLPVFALFLNIYIMFGLNKITWIRFGVWMAIGLFVYFVYGYRHSVQRLEDQQQEIHED